MHKKIEIVLVFVIIMVFSSCSFGGGRMFFDSDDKMADKRFEQVLKTIQNHDKKALTSLFSKKALAETDDFNGHMDYLFEFFQFEVKSFDNRGGPTIRESIEYGKRTKKFVSVYDVKTNKGNYVFFLLDYPVNTIHPDNSGLYTLGVIKAEDEATESIKWQNMELPGIYKPKK